MPGSEEKCCEVITGFLVFDQRNRKGMQTQNTSQNVRTLDFNNTHTFTLNIHNAQNV